MVRMHGETAKRDSSVKKGHEQVFHVRGENK